MSAVIAWGGTTLIASTALMLLVLAVRAPLRGWTGSQLGYLLWALPALRMILPPIDLHILRALPIAEVAATSISVLFIGPRDALPLERERAFSAISETLPALWLAGALGLFAIYAVRHIAFCRRLRVEGTEISRIGNIRIIAADVGGPLAFGVFRRFIAVPLGFERDYDESERKLALAHESAHHARGDLIANWASLVVLAAHWWNPIAWVAIRAFRDDQEFAADERVLAGKEPNARRLYAHVLAKAAGIGALPACNLTTRSNLKGRLMMIGQKPRSRLQLALGGLVLTLVGSTAFAATFATPGTSSSAAGKQAVTIGVKPDGSAGYTLIIGDTAVAPGAPLPGGLTLPADFEGPAACDLKLTAKPFAMVIKGMGGTRTYTVMCASAAPAPVRATLVEGLASLNTMRASVATQRQPSFPEAERSHALSAIDRSIGEVQSTLAAIN